MKVQGIISGEICQPALGSCSMVQFMASCVGDGVETSSYLDTEHVAGAARPESCAVIYLIYLDTERLGSCLGAARPRGLCRGPCSGLA